MSNVTSGLKNNKTFLSAFALACVWFGTHVGGGFATGNQAIQYYVKFGWIAAILPFIAMLLLAWVMRTSLIMAKSQRISNYKQLFTHLWQPFPKLSISFEVFYIIIMIAATGSAIAGAASLFVDLGFAYEIGVLIVGAILLGLTIFGAKLVTGASTIFSVAIIVAIVVLYSVGIDARSSNVSDALSVANIPSGYASPLWMALVYASFQAVSIPAIISCGQEMKTKSRINTFFVIGFLLNGCALGISCWMLLGWYPEIMSASTTSGQSLMALPNLFICNTLGYSWLYAAYFVALFLAFISTGVTCIFAFVTRMENSLLKDKITNIVARRALFSLIVMVISMSVSLLGLTNLVRYGYGFCGYLALVVVIIPMLTLAPIKNKKFLAANPDFWQKLDSGEWEAQKS